MLFLFGLLCYSRLPTSLLVYMFGTVKLYVDVMVPCVVMFPLLLIVDICDIESPMINASTTYARVYRGKLVGSVRWVTETALDQASKLA